MPPPIESLNPSAISSPNLATLLSLTCWLYATRNTDPLELSMGWFLLPSKPCETCGKRPEGLLPSACPARPAPVEPGYSSGARRLTSGETRGEQIASGRRLPIQHFPRTKQARERADHQPLVERFECNSASRADRFLQRARC